MVNFYDMNILPIILKRFKVNQVVISQINNEKVCEKLNKYINDNDASLTTINPTEKLISDFNDSTLKLLKNIKDYDAIFLDDDPNWYTIYNELNLIKENNNEFPLVFICNNIFPHKRRDSYINPDMIPDEFKNEFSRNLILNNNITIRDDYYHAIQENTAKNGVLTGIEDFIKKNSSIGIMDLNFLNGMTILYPKNSISQIRINMLSEEIDEYSLNQENLSDSIIENQLLSDYISKFNISTDDLNIIDEIKNELNEKEQLINEFEDKVKLHDEEISFKETQITGVSSQLNLKESQIKNYESKLINKETEINDLSNELKTLRNEVNLIQKKESELQLTNDELKENINKLNAENIYLQTKNKQLKQNENKLNSIKQQYVYQSAKIDNKEYCISCFKDEIENNHLEIQYLKNESITKKILSPLAYIYLIFKSHPKEFSLNFKLYKALKNSRCFDIGFYLSNNKDIQNSRWCKYFSPELHYVCKGFNEKRKFNKKYFNRNSKKELIEYIKTCDK